MKRGLKCILGFCFAAVLTAVGIPMTASAASGSISLSVSASSVNIGDSISVTVTGSADADALIQVNVSCDSDTIKYVGQGYSQVILEPTAGGADSATLEYKAVSPGTVNITASVIQAYDVVSQEAISISSAGKSVTVKNEAATDPGESSGGSTENPGNPENPDNPDNPDNSGNGGETTERKSSDNSLKSLTISPGRLSPDFKYSTTKYTATVGENVTSVAVDAQVSNSKASVESVTGNTNLQMGENTIKITVKAENGVIAVYSIVVTRGGTTAEDPQDPQESKNPNQDPTEETPDTGVSINGTVYKISETLPEEVLPEEFVKTSAVYEGKTAEAYSFPYEKLVLLYLIPAGNSGQEEEPEGRFFFYNAAANEFFPYIYITVGQNYALLLPDTFAETVPEGYEKTALTVDKDTVDGYGLVTEDAEKDNDFYLVYGVDKKGIAGWYRYDAADMSLQRYQEEVRMPEKEIIQPDLSEYEKAYAELQDQYNKEKVSSRKVIAVLIFLLVVAVFAIINILLFKNGVRKKKKEEEVDYIDLDDL